MLLLDPIETRFWGQSCRIGGLSFGTCPGHGRGRSLKEPQRPLSILSVQRLAARFNNGSGAALGCGLQEAAVPFRTTVMAVLLLALVLVPLSAQVRDSRPAPIRPVDGASVFRSNCAPCHGVEGRGEGPVAAALKQPVPDLTTLQRRYKGKFPNAYVRSTIDFGAQETIPAHGTKKMPIWGPIFHEIEFDQDFGNVRLENVTRYIETIQQK